MSVITIAELIPPARGDGLPWTKARIQESSTSSGPWTLLEIKNLSPVDTNPLVPQERTITTELAALENGWYRVIFEDFSGDLSSPTAPVQNVSQERKPYQPSVADVGSILRARTKDDVGNELGTFTDKTRPNSQQVINLIDTAVNDVFAAVGTSIPSSLYGDAAGVAVIGAAMLVELSFFPEQVAQGRSPYDQLEALYKLRLERLTTAVTNALDGDLVIGPVAPAQWTFPSTSPLGLDTIW